MGGGRSKDGGGRVIRSKVILLPQKILNKTSNFWPNVSKILNNCIPEVVQDTRLFFWFETQNIDTTHEIFYWNFLLDEQKISCGIFISLVQNQKNNLDIGKSPFEFLCFSSLWIINTKKISLLLICSVKKEVLDRSVKLPAVNKCNCS